MYARTIFWTAAENECMAPHITADRLRLPSASRPSRPRFTERRQLSSVPGWANVERWAIQ